MTASTLRYHLKSSHARVPLLDHAHSAVARPLTHVVKVINNHLGGQVPFVLMLRLGECVFNVSTAAACQAVGEQDAASGQCLVPEGALP